MTENGTDLDRLRQLTDEEIEQAVANDPDAVLLEDFDWQEAQVRIPKENGESVILKLNSNGKTKE
ncbi:MAG: hypothetical protein HOE48_00475 [Candidatus Latescibacteria bacterium]|nr:hypothetical protein [Candidatus Latescibacterota bacterium]MBT4136351.1 hypothetical protein [Candidatus Latescibacterota bacterium]MBT5829534.1 hypothetical protein [Candidatus Latescibacterota bacterium]